MGLNQGRRKFFMMGELRKNGKKKVQWLKCPKTVPKSLLALQFFQQKCFWLGSEKKYLHCTICRRPRTTFSKHFEAKCLYISVYLREKTFVPNTWSFYLLRGWIISIRWLTVWASQNVLNFFIWIEIFRNSTIFQHFNTSINNIFQTVLTWRVRLWLNFS